MMPSTGSGAVMVLRGCGRRAAGGAVLALALGALTACDAQGGDGKRSAGSGPSAVASASASASASVPASVSASVSASSVGPVPTGRVATACRNVPPEEQESQSDGVRAGPFDSMGAGGPHDYGVSKFWVAVAAGEYAPRALLRVEEVGDSRIDDSEPAFYVRTYKATPVPDDAAGASGNPKVTAFPGTIFLPSKGTTVRITVTIGNHTGCFLKHL